MKSTIIFSLLLVSLAASAQIGQTKHLQGEIAKFDTITVAITDPIEFQGHYYNVSDDEPVTFMYVFTPLRGAFVKDSKGIEYELRPADHHECGVLHLVVDEYSAMKLAQTNKD